MCLRDATLAWNTFYSVFLLNKYFSKRFRNELMSETKFFLSVLLL